MNSPYIHECRPILDQEKKAKLCQQVRESHTIEHAAERVLARRFSLAAASGALRFAIPLSGAV